MSPTADRPSQYKADAAWVQAPAKKGEPRKDVRGDILAKHFSKMLQDKSPIRHHKLPILHFIVDKKGFGYDILAKLRKAVESS